MESRILIFPISAILTGFRASVFPRNEISAIDTKLHWNHMKTGQ